MNCHFYKYHALGNDYIVIDPNKSRVNLSDENIWLICHRNFGIGSDGILYGPLFQNDLTQLRIFNPDGSEAEKSGNGIRIFSRYLFDAGYLTSNQFYLETLGGKVHVELLDTKANQIKVDMGPVTFFSTKIPVIGMPRDVIGEKLIFNEHHFTVSCLSIGNPHCVIPLNIISKEIAVKWGPIIENDQRFPNRINVQFLKVLDRNTIEIEIWERGAGYTLASGSSSCAAASAAFRLGLVDREVDVHMPGGTISIMITPDNHVHMTGSVRGVSKGWFAEDLLGQLSPN
jgi:diaminopimelate epimerase